VERRSLELIERQIFSLFQKRNSPRILTREVFDSSSEFANADIVRAFEDLEKKWRLVIRYTRDGNDWLSLTPAGASYAGVSMGDEHAEAALPHPPKSSTSPPEAF